VPSVAEDFQIAKHAAGLRETWQGRALANVQGPFRAVLLSVLAHNFEDAIFTLCAVVIPDFDGSLPAPMLTTAARIDKTGAVVADVVDRGGLIKKDEVIFVSEQQMRDQFRKLADRLHLTDQDRIEMFKCAQRWVVADCRLDPNMDPKDPDAKRLVLN
jgi:hypothetical protein